MPDTSTSSIIGQSNSLFACDANSALSASLSLDSNGLTCTLTPDANLDYPRWPYENPPSVWSRT